MAKKKSRSVKGDPVKDAEIKRITREIRKLNYGLLRNGTFRLLGELVEALCTAQGKAMRNLVIKGVQKPSGVEGAKRAKAKKASG